MKLTNFTRIILAARREIRDNKKNGYNLVRFSANFEHSLRNDKFVDAKVSADGTRLYLKTEPRND